MSDLRFGRSSSLFVVVLVLAAGCTPKIPKPVPIAGNLTAAAEVNPDVSGRPSPVAVKVYQLRSVGSFEASDFFKLYTQPAVALGADLVSSTEIMVRPGESKRFDQEIDPQTRFVGVVAGFRDIENAQWRAVVPVPAKNLPDQQLEVSLKHLTAAAAFTKSR
jgi:type VI secretion system protein VasD